MRRPRDYDVDLAQLDSKARQLRARKVAQLGELVIACKADTLPVELLAGALLDAVGESDATRKEAWRVRGAAMFPEARQRARSGATLQRGGGPASGRAASPADATPQS